MDRKREEGARIQCVIKKEDKSMIDVENIETGYWIILLS